MAYGDDNAAEELQDEHQNAVSFLDNSSACHRPGKVLRFKGAFGSSGSLVCHAIPFVALQLNFLSTLSLVMV